MSDSHHNNNMSSASYRAPLHDNHGCVAPLSPRRTSRRTPPPATRLSRPTPLLLLAASLAATLALIVCPVDCASSSSGAASGAASAAPLDSSTLFAHSPPQQSQKPRQPQHPLLNCSHYMALYERRNISMLAVPRRCTDKPRPIIDSLITIFTVMTVGSVGGNFLVVMSVLMVKKLQTPSNYLIVSLAMSDVLVSLFVFPFSVYTTVSVVWEMSEVACQIYISLDVLLCTASILNLCAISIDRYLIITRPLQYAAKRTPRRMLIMIGAAWTLSFLISVPPMIVDREPFRPGECSYPPSLWYQIYATTGAFYIPLIIMLILYGRIFKLARRMAQMDALQAIKLVDPVGDAASTADDVIVGGVDVAVGAVSPNNNALAEKMTPPGSTANTINNKNANNNNNNSGVLLTVTGNDEAAKIFSLNTLRQQNQERLLQKQANEKNEKKSDTKAIKTLGVIMGCFVICWLPFFVIQLLRPLLRISKFSNKEIEEIIPQSMFLLFLWLGYLNSMINPIIYAKFDREFRSPFLYIVTLRCRGMNRRIRMEEYGKRYGLPSKRPPSLRISATSTLAGGGDSTMRASRSISGTAAGTGDTPIRGRPRQMSPIMAAQLNRQQQHQQHALSPPPYPQN